MIAREDLLKSLQKSEQCYVNMVDAHQRLQRHLLALSDEQYLRLEDILWQANELRNRRHQKGEAVNKGDFVAAEEHAERLEPRITEALGSQDPDDAGELSWFYYLHLEQPERNTQEGQ